MDIAEADNLLGQQLSKLRALPYSELKRLVEGRSIQTPEAKGTSGIPYYMEVQAFWDNRRDGNIRVIVSIDDGGKSASHPRSRDFIKAPDESFVDE